MKILLVRPPFYSLFGTEKKAGNIPLGICYIASHLARDGHDVNILDCETLDFYPRETVGKARTFNLMNVHYDDYASVMKDHNHPLWALIAFEIRKYNPDIVGFSVFTPSMTCVNYIVKHLKRLKIRIVLGGPHPTALPHQSLKESGADHVVVGEGENAMLKIVNGTNKRIVMADPVKDLNMLSFPARHLLQHSHYSKNAFGYLISTRGCPYKCIFCASHTIWGRTIRFRTAKNIVDEIEEVHHNYGVNHFRFADDLFTSSKKRLRRFVEELEFKDLHVTFRCGSRVDIINYEKLELLKKAGCTEISFGVESGNQRILNLIQKNISVEQARNAVRLTQEAGIKATVFFMLGHPTETLDEMIDTNILIAQLDADRVGLNLVQVLPGTEQTRYVNGELNKDWWRYYFQGKTLHQISQVPNDKLDIWYSDTSKDVSQMNMEKEQ